MGLLAPWFLAGSLAVGLPLYLHLLRRHRTTPLPFSSLMFFERRTQSSIKHRRLRYLLLLALRLAVLLLLVLAFANPFVNRPAAGLGGDKLLLLVLDNSFSMRSGTRLEDARREALSVLASRRASDRAQVMALGYQLHIYNQQPTQDNAQLRAAIMSIKPGDSRAGYGELARTVRSLAESVHTPIEVHLFSDLQRSGMPAAFSEVTFPANATLQVHPVVQKAEPNWTVENVQAPGLVWDTKKARVQAIVAAFQAPAAARTVSLVVGGRVVATKPVQVPANGRASVEFQGLEVPYGFTRCEVRIDGGDALPADDHYLFAVERSDPRRILMVHSARDANSPLFFRAALAAAAESAFALETVTEEQTSNLSPGKYAFVILSDVVSLPESFESELTKYVNGGGSVFVIAGHNTARRPRVPVSGDPIRDTRYYARSGERFAGVGDADPSHPSLDKSARWAGVKFYSVTLVDPGNARVVAKLSDQAPILIDKKMGEGRVLILTSALDKIENDFPVGAAAPLFVPFVEQTSLYLAGTERRGGVHQVDSYLELRAAKEQSISVEVVDPDGQRPLSLKEATTVQSYQATREGFYELRRANGRHDMVAVNTDRRESDLDVLPQETISLWKGETTQQQNAGGSGASNKQEQEPYSLWWYVMLFLLAAAVAESLFASRYLGIEREAP